MNKHQGQFAAGRRTAQSLSKATVTLLFASGAIMPAQQSADPFPLAVGNYWIYQGRVTIPLRVTSPTHLLPPESKEMTWRSEITKVAYRKDGVEATGRPSIVVAVFDNFPLGLTAWYPGSEGPLGILIEVNSARFYAITYSEAAIGNLE